VPFETNRNESRAALAADAIRSASGSGTRKSVSTTWSGFAVLVAPKPPLTFDPRGREIAIAQGATILFSHQFPQ
jgi:hypothetical protein